MFKLKKIGKTNINAYEKEANILVFLFILLAILILALVFVTSKIEIKIVNLVVDSQSKNYIGNKYEIIIKLKILGNIPIIKIKLTKNKLQKIYKNLKMKEKIKKLEEDIYTNKDKIDLKLIELAKEIKKSIDVDYLNLVIKLGTENAFTTAIIVAIISTIISVLVSNQKIEENELMYKIEPIYNNQNLIKFQFSGIFKIKMIHIINIMYLLNKKGGINKYERTSNRRSYDYSYD